MKEANRSEKITVYLTPEELEQLELAKLDLRKDGIRADRGKVVRALMSIGLDDYSKLRKRLRNGEGG